MARSQALKDALKKILGLEAEIAAETINNKDWNTCYCPTCQVIRDTQGSHTEVMTVDDLLVAAANK